MFYIVKGARVFNIDKRIIVTSFIYYKIPKSRVASICSTQHVVFAPNRSVEPPTFVALAIKIHRAVFRRCCVDVSAGVLLISGRISAVGDAVLVAQQFDEKSRLVKRRVLKSDPRMLQLVLLLQLAALITIHSSYEEITYCNTC